MLGKREEERGERPRAERSESSSQNKSFLQQPQAATRGRLGIDLETTIDVTLNNTTVHEIPSSAAGPLINQNSKLEGLLVGHSSAGVKGLLVIPRVINIDYVGQIHVMAHALCPPLFVAKGSRIAQIVGTSNSLNHSSAKTLHGDQSLDSMGPAVCFTTKMDHRPTMSIIMSQRNESVQIYAMLDTGADVSIVSTIVWPEEWPVSAPTAAIAGVGGHSTTMMSKHPVQMTFPEGQEVSLRVYIMQLTGTLPALIGRDVLSQIGAVLTTNPF